MTSKNGIAAADEARGVPEFDLLASGINRENNSATAPAQAAPIVVTIGGPAVAKGRARFTRKGFAYTPAKTRKYEAHGRLAAQVAMADKSPFAGPVHLTALIELPIPGSWSKRRCASAIVGDIRPTSRPDIDKLLEIGNGCDQRHRCRRRQSHRQSHCGEKVRPSPKACFVGHAARRASFQPGGAAMSRNRLPNRRDAQIMMFEHGGRPYRATFGCFDNGDLAEIFLDIGKPDSTLQVHADDSAVLVSLLLQHRVLPVTIRRSISGPIGVALDIWLCGGVEE